MGLIHINSMEGHIGPFYWTNAYYAYETFIDPGDTEAGFVGLECFGSFAIDWSGFLNDVRCILMCSPSQGFFSSPTDPPDRSDAADAARFRWLLDGHGYFLEESHLCGHGPGEEDEARRAIDKRMSQEEFDALMGPTTPSL